MSALYTEFYLVSAGGGAVLRSGLAVAKIAKSIVLLHWLSCYVELI